MANATSLLTVENKKEIAKKIGTLNKIQQALGQNPALTLDMMLMNTQISPAVRANYEKLMLQARTLIAVTMQQAGADKDTQFRALAVQDCFKELPDLLLLSYALELRLNGFKPITPAVQKEAENRFVSYCETPMLLNETSVSDVFVPEQSETIALETATITPAQPGITPLDTPVVAPIQSETAPVEKQTVTIQEIPDVSESLANSSERDVLKRELMKRTRALIKLNETNRVMKMNGHKVPYPILNPYFDEDGHLNIGFTDLTNNAYLLDYLKIHKNKTDILSEVEKETLLVGWNDIYEDMGQPTMTPDEFASLDGFKEYSIPPDNASQVADIQISDDVDDLMLDLETADLSQVPLPFLQVALDIVYETGYALSETNPAFFNALLTGNFEGLTDEDYTPHLDDMVWNNVQRAKRRRVLVQMGIQQLQQQNARPMGGAGKVAQTPDMPTPTTGQEKQK